MWVAGSVPSITGPDRYAARLHGAVQEAKSFSSSVGIAAATSAGPGRRCPFGAEVLDSWLTLASRPWSITRTLISGKVATDRLHTAADSPERTLAAVRSTFRGAANVELLSARVGVRPMPADGEPIVGPVAEVPGLYRSPSCASKPVAARAECVRVRWRSHGITPIGWQSGCQGADQLKGMPRDGPA